MGLAQTVRDKFWVGIARKPAKVFPTRVVKYKKRGDNWKKEFDRGRKYTDPETGEEEYQFMNEHHAADSVPYKYVRETSRGPELSVLMPDRDVFVPFRHSFELNNEDENKIELDYNLDQKNWYRWKENEWARTSQIVEEDNNSWLEENSTAIMVMMLGLGFLFSFYGFGEYIIGNLEQISQAMPSDEAVRQLAEAYQYSQ